MEHESPLVSSITLLTDFGTRDAYVAAMKGVIASIAPRAQVVDISHDVEPQAVAQAGFLWYCAVRYFPPGTVHVAVIDPEVGTDREILAVEARGAVFLAPDNGLIGYALRRSEVRRAVFVQRPDLYLKPLSRTFHGRDIFAPVAAHLAMGAAVAELGPEAKGYRWSSLPRERLRRRGNVFTSRGEVLDVDRFGNVITNLTRLPSGRWLGLDAGGHRVSRLARSYADAARGEAVVVEGSSGFLELSVREGSAAERLGLKVGDAVRASWKVEGRKSKVES